MPPWEKYQQKGPWSKYQAAEPGVMQSLNLGISEGFGFPVDLVNMGLQQLGMGSERPFMGSEDIRQGLEGWGRVLGMSEPMVPPSGVQPKDLPGRIGRGVGQATGALMPFGALAKGLAGGTGTAAAVGQQMLQSPKVATGFDIASGVGAGAGGYVASQVAPDNELADILGQLAGGLTPAGAIGTAKGAMALAEKMPVMGQMLRGGKRLLPGAGRVRAEDRVRGLVGDPDAAAARMTDETIADLTPAQRTGERKLMALERAVVDEDAALSDEFAARTDEAVRVLREAMRGTGDVDDARTFIQNRQERLEDALTARIQQAGLRAQESLSRLDPELIPEGASRVVREEVDRAFAAARTQDRELWEAVPLDVEVDTTKSRLMYHAFRGELVGDAELQRKALPRAQLDKIPDKARRFLDPESNEKFGDREPVLEVWGLRSELLDEARRLKARQENKAARVARELADALLEDLGAVAGRVKGEAGERLREALNFHRDMSERFERGAVGKMLRSASEGGDVYAPEVALEATVRRGGAMGGAAIDDILTASSGTRFGVGDYLLNEFQRQAVRGGRVNPEAARKFLTSNVRSLRREEFRYIGEAIEDAIKTQDAATVAQRVGQERLKKMGVTAAGRFAAADIGDEFASIIKAKAPKKAAQDLVRIARRDPTGKALDGLKASAFDHLSGRAARGALTDTGEQLPSGRALKAAMKDRKTMDAVSEILSPVEINRMRKIADELTNIEISQGALPDVGPPMADTPNKVLNMIASILAAQQGRVVAARMGGGTVQTPGIFAGRARELMQRLTNDRAAELIRMAVQDRELFKALLTQTGTAAGMKRGNARLNAWLAGPGSDFLDSLEETEE